MLRNDPQETLGVEEVGGRPRLSQQRPEGRRSVEERASHRGQWRDGQAGEEAW